MSYDASVTFVWGDGEHRFRLALKQLQELQSKCNAGPMEIIDRLVTRRWRVEDIREIIRLGLIGGGLTPLKAHTLVERYVDNRPWAESLAPAQTILYTAMVGDLTDSVGKDEAGETKSEATQTTAVDLSFPQSLAPVQ